MRRSDASASSTQSSSTVENLTWPGDDTETLVTRPAVGDRRFPISCPDRAYRVQVTVSSTLDHVAAEEFVLLTTFRRDGSPVAVPVWIARDGDALVVSTPASTGKVKRLRRDPRVELRPCSRRGRVQEGAEPVTGLAEVVQPEPHDLAALQQKYGWQYRIGTMVERLVRGRRERVILRITLTEPAA